MELVALHTKDFCLVAKWFRESLKASPRLHIASPECPMSVTHSELYRIVKIILWNGFRQEAFARRAYPRAALDISTAEKRSSKYNECSSVDA